MNKQRCVSANVNSILIWELKIFRQPYQKIHCTIRRTNCIYYSLPVCMITIKTLLVHLMYIPAKIKWAANNWSLNLTLSWYVRFAWNNKRNASSFMKESSSYSYFLNSGEINLQTLDRKRLFYIFFTFVLFWKKTNLRRRNC